MQFKFFTFAALALSTLAVATPTRRNDSPSDQCDTGSLQCCQTVTTANSNAASTIISLLGIVVQDATAVVGLTCSPIDVIGVSSNSCTAQPVCCDNDSFNGVIALGCTPVNIGL